MTPRARIVRAAEALAPEPLWTAKPSEPQRRRMAREELEARLAADRIVEEARATAHKVLADAHSEAAGAAAVAAREAQAEADAKLAAQWLLLRQAEQARPQQDEDRTITLAVALAERLLVASLELDPTRIGELARAVMAEAGGARRAVIDAHPLDVDPLRSQLSMTPLDIQSIEVRQDAELARGELRLHTDLGIIDARLAPRLDRLAAAVRDTFK
jgi:flagellar biosynthesis/type III secretory pathway protein FliH